MWIAIGHSIYYGLLMTYSEYDKNVGKDINRETYLIVMVGIAKSVKIIIDTTIHYMFVRFLIFFLKYRT